MIAKYIMSVNIIDCNHCPKCGSVQTYLTTDETERFIRCGDCRTKFPCIMIVDGEQR